MKKYLILLICLLSFLLVAQDNRIQSVIENGPGVTNTKFNKNGELTSFMVVGTGRIRKSLPKHLALQQARKDAAREARNETSKFFNTSVKWAETAGNVLVCVTKGTAAGDEEGSEKSKEESQYREASGEKSKAASEAALSGLRKVGSGYDSNGIYCEVWGWQYKSVKAIINASKTMGKAARASVNEAKAVQGARLQDPNAAYRKAEKRDARNKKRAKSYSNGKAGYGRNSAPVQTTTAAPDADEFF